LARRDPITAHAVRNASPPSISPGFGLSYRGGRDSLAGQHFEGSTMNRKTGLAVAFLAVAASAASAGAGYAAGAAAVPKTGREPLFENPQAKVWKSVITPNTPLPFHRHEHPRALIALEGGTMKILEEDGTSEIHEWQSGKAYWLPANAPGTRHQDVNVGPKPIEVIVVELSKES
jgi:quercetin dioxygenase-like cupin family protein